MVLLQIHLNSTHSILCTSSQTDSKVASTLALLRQFQKNWAETGCSLLLWWFIWVPHKVFFGLHLWLNPGCCWSHLLWKSCPWICRLFCSSDSLALSWDEWSCQWAPPKNKCKKIIILLSLQLNGRLSPGDCHTDMPYWPLNILGSLLRD